MNVFRVLPLVGGVLLGVIATASPAVAEICTKEVDATTITLKKNQSSAYGVQLGQFNCWMPKLPASDKDLCKHGSAAAHTFTITLANECDDDVKMMLKLKGGGSLHFQGPNCGNGAVLFNDFVAGPSSTPVVCTSTTYSTTQPKRATDFELKATHVRNDSGVTPVDADYDPEIAVKDPSGIKGPKGLWAVAIIGGGLLLWYLARRRRKSTR